MNYNNINININFGTQEFNKNAKSAEKTAQKVEKAIKKIPEKKTTTLKLNSSNFLETTSKMALSWFGIINFIQGGLGKVQEFIDLSNVQEAAEQKLADTLKIKSQYTDEAFASMKNYASSIQEVTTVGDEQSLKLMAQAVNFGVSVDKMNEATRGSIGLAEKFKDAGMSQETALKGIALAFQGNFSQLERYIPALRNAGTEAEKMTILQKEMGDGFDLAKAKAETGAGALEQAGNSFGDTKEKIGDLIKIALVPLSKILKSLFDYINQNDWIWDSVKAGLILTTALIAVLTAKFLILNATMLLNPVVLIITGVLALSFALGKLIHEIGGFTVAWKIAKQVTKNVINAIFQFVSNLLTFLKDFSIVTIKILTAPFRAMLLSAQNAVQGVADLFEALKNRDWAGVKEAGKNIGKALQSGFIETGEDIEKDLAKMGESLVNMMPDIDGVFAADIPERKEPEKKEPKKPKEQKTDHDAKTKEELKKERERQEKIKALREYYAQTDIQREYARKEKKIELERQKALAEAESLKAGNELKAAINAEYDEKLKALNEEKEIEKKEKEIKEKEYYEQLKAEELKLKGMEKEAEMLALDEEYIAKREKYAHNQEILLQLEQNYEKKKHAINSKYRKKELTDLVQIDTEKKNHLNQMFENSKYLGKAGFEFFKKTQIANAVISTYTGAQEAYKSLAGIPIVGPALAVAAAAAAIAAGFARVKSIQAQKMEEGGYLKGKYHAQGGIPIEAEGGEYVINKKRVDELGKGFFDFLNFSPAKVVNSYFKEKVQNLPQFRFGGFVQRFAYEAGGMVQSDNRYASDTDFSPLLNKLDDIEDAIIQKEMSVTINGKEYTPVELAQQVDIGNASRFKI